MEQKSKKLAVSLNIPVKLRFRDGTEITIKIVDQKMKTFEPIIQEEFLISSKTIFAQAILGHRAGEQIKYKAEGKIKKVAILEIQ